MKLLPMADRLPLQIENVDNSLASKRESSGDFDTEGEWLGLPLDIPDTYMNYAVLSTGGIDALFSGYKSPIQCAVPILLEQRKNIQQQLLERVRNNLAELDRQLAKQKACQRLNVQGGWCVFANEGCVLQKVGMAEGKPWKYKPSICVSFPVEKTQGGSWYIRQWNYRGEIWDLFCLNPKEDPTPARISLREEIEFSARRERKRR